MWSLFVDSIIPVFFVYGLAFFTMGLIVAFEAAAHIVDRRMSRTLMKLAAFALIHGTHEWLEMFIINAQASGVVVVIPGLRVIRLVVLAVSFCLLCMYGLDMTNQRRGPAIRALAPVLLVVFYTLGAVWIGSQVSPGEPRFAALDAWTRYSLGMLGGVLAGWGLLLGAREYRHRNLRAVASGWTVAGVALAVYGVVGQSAPGPSSLFPSTLWNTEVFRQVFGFPVQILRAGAALTSTAGLLGALRALERERQDTLIRAREQAREEMARRATLQKDLLRHMVTAQEEERTRIARELHDQIGQTLTALNYRATALESALAGGREVAVASLDDLHKLSKQSLADLRRLVTDLRPAQLDDLGLAAALHWLADNSQKRLKLAVEVLIEGKRQRLSGEVETALFRITQEALTNVTRHAGVDYACVRLTFEEALVRLEIRDEGKGFNVHPIVDYEGTWGLIGMRERALSVDGRFEMTSAPGSGTTVSIEIPVLESEMTHG